MTHPAKRRIDKKKNINLSPEIQPNKANLAVGGINNNNYSNNMNIKSNSAQTDSTMNSNRRVLKGQVGTSAIDAIQKWTIQLKPFELQFPHNIETFHEMYSRDEAVGGVLNATYALVENAFSSYKMLSSPNNEDSKKSADLLEYFFNNMNQSTMRTFARNAATFNQFGFCVIEKDYRKFVPDTYTKQLPKGVDKSSMWMIDRLRMIPQRSLDPSEPFIIGNQGRDILGVRQNLSWFQNSSHALRSWIPQSETVTLRRNKFMLMGMNVTDSTPMGVSPLEQVWNSWKLKKFYENYQSVGVSKDMAGMPLLEVPLDILDKAAIDPSSPEGLLVDQMCKDVASMHAGEQNMMLLPSDTQEGSSSVKDYNLKFLGVDGGGKQHDLQAIINKQRESIYSSFGALNLISSESSGGYNQLEGQNSIHLYFVKRIIRIIEESINQDLIPQLLSLNNIKLDPSEYPKFKAGEIEPISLEEFSKMIQRITSVGQMPITPELTNEILEKSGLDYRLPDNLTQDEYDQIMSDFTSRSGLGKGTSGTGDTQNSSGGDNNMDNTA